MESEKKLIFLAHCLLNQSTMPEERRVYEGNVRELLQFLAEKDIGIIQMPCPWNEFKKTSEESGYLQIIREKKYRVFCKKIAKIVVKEVESYLKSDCKVLCILGVEFSPTCGVHQIEQEKSRVTPGRGVLIEEIEEEMRKRNFQIPIIGVNPANVYPVIERLEMMLSFI